MKVLLIIFSFMSFLIGTKNQCSYIKTKSYQVTINHPGENHPIALTLNQVLDSNEVALEYYADVKSVICLEEVCKIISVRIFWNNLGEYLRFSLEKGATLEKYKADFFELDDYVKLQHILSNIHSPFRDVLYHEILIRPDEHGTEDIDAVSGATALVLNKEDTVPGAALTCYTLWHWANGDIKNIIKNITSQTASEAQLLNFLTDENRAYFELMIDELISRKLYTSYLVDTVFIEVLKNDELLGKGFLYINELPKSLYLKVIYKFYSQTKTNIRLEVIKSLKDIEYDISDDFFEQLSNEINEFMTFQEVSNLLDLFQQRKAKTPTLIQNIMKLLSKDILTSRRAYWFLKTIKLSSNQEKVVNEFYKKNKKRL
ncbi:hypothetical protein [Seonamhaeicola marinus]|uniref:Uncharacterized protein n=1 Tax=Seonamhaeicola marinus TaxID=1912246 RepID=A0A5D0J1J0_9FLAO|nr:hypothetical protein [Seonamhaeicola marinus]TYA89219.1 hypothetical protein FUA24_03535 [Seonamhaeicola marinus]